MIRNPFRRDSSVGTPDPPGPDERVRRALEAVGYAYTVKGDAHTFFVTIRYPDTGRSQSVQIESATQSDLGPPWRRIWSVAFEMTGPLPWEKALVLLTDNDTRTSGAWTLGEHDGRTKVWFRVSIPADAPPDVLKEAVLAAAWAADEMERTTTGADDQ